MIYQLGLFLPFLLSSIKIPGPKKIGVSILICAKNEAENLRQFIPKILEQDYPDFELVLINDDSKDESLDVMQQFERQDPRVKVVNVKPIDSFWNNKKYPLTLGIKAAKNDFLLLTDADCIPRSDQWIRTMSSHFSNQKTVVIGYGAYKRKKGSFLNLLIRFETLLTAIQYFAYALRGLPYMAVGRNLAYRRDEFFNVGGFQSHMHLRSGDDDLFINQVANAENTAVCTQYEGTTESIPCSNFKDWINQKRRHVSTASHYKTKHKFFLSIFYLTQLLFWILGISLLIIKGLDLLVIGLIGMRLLAVGINYVIGSRKLKEPGFLLLWPLLELSLIILQLVIFIFNLTSKPQTWR